MTLSSALVALISLFLGGLLGWLLHAQFALRFTKIPQEDPVDAAQGISARISSSLAPVMAPLRESVLILTNQVDAIEKQRIHSYASLTEQVVTMQRTSRRLADETTRLVGALRSPQVRGRWGELQLERVVELSGMRSYCDFDTQVSLNKDGKTLRPDLVVRLSQGRSIVVDAKVPFDAYLEALDADTDASQQLALKKLAQATQAHINSLYSKRYWGALPSTPEFVVLFVPGDGFLDAAMEADPSLLEHAFRHNVVLATPSSLIALLRTVALTWRHNTLSQEATTIRDLGRELYERIGTVSNHVSHLGIQLKNTVAAYNQTLGSLDKRVLVTARKLAEVGLDDGPSYDIPQPVETLTRDVPPSISSPIR